MTTETRDIVVIGGGPAGAAVGLALAKLAPELAARTVILEAAVHPRDKVCGGGLTGDIQAWLRTYGIELRCEQTAIRRTRGIFDGWTREAVLEQPLRVVRRRDFDAELIAAVRSHGVEVREGEPVLATEIHDDHALVRLREGTVRARAVVAADGMRSRIARGLDGGRRPKVHLAQAFVPRRSEHDDDLMVFDFTRTCRDLKGYAWLFPCSLGGRPAYNVGLMQTASVHGGGGMVELLRRCLAPHGYHVDRREIAHWPEWPFDPRYPFAGPRVLTVGDAAGVEPLFGEGLSQCFAYGDLAARELSLAFERGDFSFRGYRRRVLSSRLGAELRLLRVAARLAYGPANRFWVNPLFTNEHVYDAMAQHCAGSRRVLDHPVRTAATVIGRSLSGLVPRAARRG